MSKDTATPPTGQQTYALQRTAPVSPVSTVPKEPEPWYMAYLPKPAYSPSDQDVLNVLAQVKPGYASMPRRTSGRTTHLDWLHWAAVSDIRYQTEQALTRVNAHFDQLREDDSNR